MGERITGAIFAFPIIWSILGIPSYVAGFITGDYGPVVQWGLLAVWLWPCMAVAFLIGAFDD